MATKKHVSYLDQIQVGTHSQKIFDLYLISSSLYHTHVHIKDHIFLYFHSFTLYFQAVLASLTKYFFFLEDEVW